MTPLFSTALVLTFALPPHQDDTEIPEGGEVVTTDSGLSYSVLQEGDGSAPPRLGDRVRVHYTGWLEDGTVFDSSRRRGEPSEFGLGMVIEGWNEGLQMMSPGARYKLTIPAELGYGEAGTQGIPPNATLIFDVELIAITARHHMPFVAWGGEDAETTEKGIALRAVDEGEGPPVTENELLWLEFALWNEGGELLWSDILWGRPLIMDPGQPQLAFLADVLPSLRSGTRVIARVPVKEIPELGDMDKLDPEGHALWQFRVAATANFDKPEFVLPPDEELTATGSGLKYKVLREGSQLGPSASSQITAHYAGWLTDGTQFDASYDRGRPLNGPLRGLIEGWKEGMQLMGPGSKFLFVIPPDLGYGSADKGTIPPESTLVFVVELIDFR